MRSIFKMPSDDMAGDAKRRVPLPIDRRKAKCEAFVEWLPTICPRAEANGRYFEKGGRLNAEHLWNGFRRFARERRRTGATF